MNPERTGGRSAPNRPDRFFRARIVESLPRRAPASNPAIKQGSIVWGLATTRSLRQADPPLLVIDSRTSTGDKLADRTVARDEPGMQRARDRGDARDQPAAADRDDQRIEIGPCAEHLQRNRPLPGNDKVVVKRMNQGQPAFGDQPRDFGRGLGEVGADQQHFGAELGSALRLTDGVETGITMVAGIPNCPAW